MSRPRTKARRDLPTGLWYRKDRKTYVFQRIDGSVVTLCKEKARAVRLAQQYNANYRIDSRLAHIPKTQEPIDQRILTKLKDVLPSLFSQLASNKGWSPKYTNGRKNEFKYIVEFFGNHSGADINISVINEYLEQRNHNRSDEQYNRSLGLLTELFDYCVDQSYMDTNPASKKIRRTLKSKSASEIERITLEQFRAIHQLAGKKQLVWLQVAMELSLQTSHAVLEISRIKYNDIDTHLKVKRQKNQRSKASAVKIPMNDELNKIVEFSRQDGVDSPFVVHRQRAKRYRGRPLGAGIEHETQIASEDISRKFSDLRDELGFYVNINPRRNRPGFHDIRALSIFLQEEAGHNAQHRAAHSRRQTTEGYIVGHVNWNEVSDVVIEWRNQTNKEET